MQEVQAGAAIWLKPGDYIGWRGLALLMLDRVRRAAGLLDTSAGGGTANTALACHAARLLALHEGVCYTLVTSHSMCVLV